MNQEKLIRATIDKYSDFPQVQADMRKVLKYASSQTRMFLDPIIYNQPANAVSPNLAALRASTDAFEASEACTAEVKADALEVLKAVTAELVFSRPGTLEALQAVNRAKYANQPEVVRYLDQSAAIMLAEIEALPPAEVLKLRKAA